MRRSAVALLIVACTVSACDPTIPPTEPNASPTQAATPPVTEAPVTEAPVTEAPTASPTIAAPAVSWVRQSTSGDVPDARWGHSWTADPSDAAAYLFGGVAGGVAVADVWRYDLGADVWEERTPTGQGPVARSEHVAAWRDDVGVVVYGGMDVDGAPLADLWTYDPRLDAWREVAMDGDPPAGRAGACAAVAPDDRIWISGGRLGDGTATDDLWIVDPSNGSWETVDVAGPGPAARSDHACWWTLDGEFVVYGGTQDGDASGDRWSLRGAADGTVGPSAAWSAITDAEAGARSGAAWTRVGDRSVVVGGQDLDGATPADVVAFDLGSTSVDRYATPADAPADRILGTLADDPGGERTLLFGGRVASSPTDELWRLELP